MKDQFSFLNRDFQVDRVDSRCKLLIIYDVCLFAHYEIAIFGSLVPKWKLLLGLYLLRVDFCIFER